MKLGENSTHTFYTTDLPKVDERRCFKLVHKRTGEATYKLEFSLKTFKTIKGLEKYVNKLISA